MQGEREAMPPGHVSGAEAAAMAQGTVVQPQAQVVPPAAVPGAQPVRRKKDRSPRAAGAAPPAAPGREGKEGPEAPESKDGGEFEGKEAGLLEVARLGGGRGGEGYKSVVEA